MALFTKLFPRFRTTQNQNEDKCSSEKLCQFDVKQVRLVLFRECDFRGRKLLFDSDATQKVPLEKKGENENFVEVHDGFGYTISKQNYDYAQLSEMIFGSVAMSYRGTYFKIHSLSEPFRLLFTQVFPSPRASRRRTSSSSHRSHLFTHSFDHSVRLDDSGASSTYSSEPQMSDRSTRSTASDTVLVCKRLQSSPIDLGHSSGILSKNSLIVDSGCGDNHSSFSSISTGPLRFDTWESAVSYKGTSSLSFSSFTHLKHLYRSSSRSLQSSACSLPNSTEDVIPRGHHRSSKLGLCLILDIPQEDQEFLTQFLMEHIALLESMMCRARVAIEAAYHRPPTFISNMVELCSVTAQWLVNLLCGPAPFRNLWHCLSVKNCDKFDSISNISGLNKVLKNCGSSVPEFSGDTSENSSFDTDFLNRTKSCNFLENSIFFNLRNKEREFSFNLGKFLKTESGDTNSKVEGFIAETFLNEFCEVLEEVDVKDTNFFVSTLLTAVLTHHLGWVATCYPSTSDMSTFKNPYNALWSQLTDLYGAVGYPVKTAQTILTGNNKNNVMTKLLNCLTYFIRCSNIERKTVERSDVDLENKTAEVVCTQAHCIPKESYKKYEEHVREILVENCLEETRGNSDFGKVDRNTCESSKMLNNVEKCEDLEVHQFEGNEKPRTKGLSKVKTHTNLSAFHGELETKFDKNYTFDTNVLKDENEATKEPKNDVSMIQKSKTLTKLSIFCDLTDSTGDVDFNDNLVEDTDSDVIFVLGDDDKLVNLKKETDLTDPRVDKSIDLIKAWEKVEKDSKTNRKKDNFLDLLRNRKLVDPFREEFFNNNCQIKLKPSSSYESVCPTGNDQDLISSGNKLDMNKFERCRSEPPEDIPKFKYSRVKFNLQQYPQVVRNYMKSKNLELENLPFENKFGDDIDTVDNNMTLDFSGYEADSEVGEVLQTPSNASELEGTSEIGPTTDKPIELSSTEENVVVDKRNGLDLKERAQLDDIGERSGKKSCKSGWILGGSESIEKNEVIEPSLTENDCKETGEDTESKRMMKIIELPMPRSIVTEDPQSYSVSYSSSVMKGLVETFIPDMVLQGTIKPEKMWIGALKNNLAINAQHSMLDQPVEESLAILANTDTWEVQVISSHTYVIDKNASGVRVGMSQLVSNMLESLLTMWRSHIPPQYCLIHIENKLQELCVLSKALAQLLLASEFCSMEVLTSTLHLEVNDVPLLMAVASTHTPQVTEKYGLSFQ